MELEHRAVNGFSPILCMGKRQKRLPEGFQLGVGDFQALNPVRIAGQDAGEVRRGAQEVLRLGARAGGCGGGIDLGAGGDAE